MDQLRVVVALLILVTALAGVARKLHVPDPIALVLSGLIIGVLPGFQPDVQLDPNIVFVVFLPPILFAAGYFTSIRDFKAYFQKILLLSIGLVIFTALIVALVMRALVPELPFGAAFALGAIVAPTDAVAATAVFRRLGVPRGIVTILEGESLLNDATALVLFRTAVIAVTGSVSLGEVGIDFVTLAVGGVVVGLVFGWLASLILRRIDDAVLGIVLTLLIPAAAYLVSESLHVSGVLATVVAGLYAGHASNWSLNSAQRVAGEATWSVVLFLLNGVVFILIGLQLPSILADLDQPAGELIGVAVAVSLTVIVTRIVWVYPAMYLPWLIARVRGRAHPPPDAATLTVVAWAGMRGVVSLAAALTLPLEFPGRSLILFLTFAVILATLVVQGLTLAPLIRAVGVVADAGTDDEERTARRTATESAVQAIGELERQWPDHRPLVDQLRTQYEHRLEHIEVDGQGPRNEAEQELLEHRLIRRAVIDAERTAILRLRDDGTIGDEAMRRIERDLDLEELRLEA